MYMIAYLYIYILRNYVRNDINVIPVFLYTYIGQTCKLKEKSR